MDWSILLLITFLAATVQAVIGFGFGLICVSVFLIMLDSVAAIQLVMIITLAMSTLHWTRLKKHTPRHTLKWIMAGCLLGFPFGILIYQFTNLEAIKLAVALIIIAISLHNGWQLFKSVSISLDLEDSECSVKPHYQQQPLPLFGVGIISGLMASSIAMPGPSVMLYLATTSLTKNQIRATIIIFFIFSYSGALLLQTFFIGVDLTTWITAAMLIPVALIGVVTGDHLANRINQQLFKALVLVVLLLTAVFMLVNL